MSAPEKLALVAGDERVSFADLARRIESRVAGLRDRADGRFLRLTASPTSSFVVDFLAALEHGIPMAVFPSDWTRIELEKREAYLAAHEAKRDPAAALILFTSGSTGSFKAVQLSRDGIEANTRAVIESLDFARARESGQTLFLPLSYSFGLLGQLLPAIRAGVATRLLSDFTQALAWADPGRMSGMWSGVASHWETIVRAFESRGPFPLVTHVVSAGAYLRAPVKARLRALFPRATLYGCYGQTEASPRILCLSSEGPEFFGETVGRPVAGIEARFDSEGLLEVRGPQLMLGYLGDPVGTAERLVGGWLRTGDLGSIDGEGRIHIRGRLDDLVKIAGERVSCQEVERELASIPGISEAAVLAIDHAVYGTVLGAVVCGRPAPPERELARLMGERVSARKIPKVWWYRESLPRNANGKVDRTRLRAEFAQEGRSV